MHRLNFRRTWVSFMLSFLLILSLAVSIMPQTIVAESVSPYQQSITDSSGRQLIQAIFPAPPQKPEDALVDMRKMSSAGATNILSDVPAFDWSYGCAATSAAMLFGYYDRIGYSNMYTGTTNSGVCPLDNSVWGHTSWTGVICGECPLSATHNGIDDSAIRGHVDDYWVGYGYSGTDPYVSSGWEEHAPDCAGDYMGTNQAKYGNTDGSTMLYFNPSGDPLYDYAGSEPAYRDACHGMKLFAQSRGYTVVTNFNQLIQGHGTNPSKGFTFADFQAEIDAGRPVLILVTGHAMLGYGYDTATDTIYVRNTWDYGSHTMVWGGTYSGMQHFAVSVIRLQTMAAPPSAPTLKSPASGSTVFTLAPTLEWNASSGATDYSLQVATDSAFTALLVDQSGITGLYHGIASDTFSWDTMYCWRVNASNSYGASSWSSYSYFVTSGPPPDAPSNLVATTVSSSQIDLTWQDNSSDETGFKVERKAGSGSYSQIATVGAGVTSYSNTALSASTTYYYQLRAYNAAGNSDYSNEALATTLAPPPLLSAPSNLTATPISSSQINLTWQDNSDNDSGFEIQRKTGSGSYSQIATVGAGVTSYSNTALSASTTYYYRVRAYNAAGNSEYSDEASAITLPVPPPPPGTPTLKSPATRSTVPTLTPTLEWNASSEAVSYGVQVSTSSRFTNLLVNQTGITHPYYDIAPAILSWNTIYYWRVNASNTFGSTSSWSTYGYFRTAAGPPPNAPSNLVATPVSSSQIDLTWQDNSSDETGFKIERKTVSGSYFQIATVGAGITGYSNAALGAGTTYYYRVSAYGAAGNSEYSGEASATTLPVPPPPPGTPTLKSPPTRSTVPTLTPTLEWSASSEAISYGVQVSTSYGFTDLVVNETGIADPYYDIAPGILNGNTIYYWRVNASGTFGGTSGWSRYGYFRTPAGP